MGKATRWFRSLFGAKKSSRSTSRSQPKTYGASSSPGGIQSGGPLYHESSSVDANKHAIAVAAATAAVAEAALAAAHAAAEVVRLTTGGSSSGGGSRGYYGCERRREVAAVKIQSAFRAYLARRALRALKGLVKLQALVRGHIVRKQSADMLRRMQAMARVQARACANRACRSVSPQSSSRSSHSHSHHHPRSSSTLNAKVSLRMGSNWLDSWMEETSWSSKYGRPDDEKSDKILEVDTWMPHLNPSPNVKSTFNSHNAPIKPQKPMPNPLTREVLPLGSMIIREAEKAAWTAENTPRAYSASSRPGSSHRRSPFTPGRGEYSQSVFGDYPSHPNYMANTESSRARLRSHSAPRQRIQFERSGSTQRFLDYSDTNSERGFQY